MRKATVVKRDVVAEVTGKVLEALEAGVAPWVKPWKGTTKAPMAIHAPRNYVSGKAYRGMNVLLLLITAADMGYSDPRWLTFKQCQAAGGRVRKGEKGTHLIFWKFIDGKQEEGEEAVTTPEGTTSYRGKPGKKAFARFFVVFNAEQCEGLEQLKVVSPTSESIQGELGAIVSRLGARVVHGGDRACYVPAFDVINMPVASDFRAEDDYRSTLLHELAHWTGHTTRLARDMKGRFGDESYAFEELVAELSSAFSCAQLGITAKLQHAEYIGNWLKVLKGDKHAIFTAARLAQEASEFILGGGAEEDEQEGEELVAA